MTTYNTGNPVGSSDPLDLYDNAENFDQAMNSTSDTFVDRLGVTRSTLHGYETLATGIPAVEASIVAQAAADAALIGAGVYPDEATGRAAVADGAYFKVQGSGDVAAYEYRRVNSSTSTLVAAYPASSAFDSLSDEWDDYRLWDFKFSGTSEVTPITVDDKFQVLLGLNTTTGEIVGAVAASGGGSTEPTEAVEAALNHIIYYGQSLSVGAVAGDLISTTQPYDNVTFAGGPRAWNGTTWSYSPLKPLVEDATAPAPDGDSDRMETCCSGTANYATTRMINRGVQPEDHVILASTAGRGGSSITQINKEDNTANWYQNLLAQVTAAKAIEPDYAVQLFCWMQGESDDTITRSQYLAKLTKLYEDFKADTYLITEQPGKMFAATYQTSTRMRSRTAPNGSVAMAQLDFAKTVPGAALASPCYHLPFADSLHLSAVGYKWMGGYFGRIYDWIMAGEEPKWLDPLSAIWNGGTQIRVLFDVPTLPLVFDASALAVTTDHGFAVDVGGSVVTINNLAISGSEVVITLAATPGSTPTVRYGIDYTGTGLTASSIGSGNLRDSTTDTVLVDGVSKPLYHVCPAFTLPAVVIGE